METFRDFVVSTFLENGYRKIGTLLDSLHFFKSEQYEDYWLLGDEDGWYERQVEVFQEMQSIYETEYPFAEKNTSLLMLCDVAIKDLQMARLIEIENDPIYFKKYVLTYTNDACSKLLNLKGVLDIADLAMDSNVFNEMFKETHIGPTTLLYSMMHKLPFLPIKQSTSKIQQHNMDFTDEENSELMGFLESLSNEDNIISIAVSNLINISSDDKVKD